MQTQRLFVTFMLISMSGWACSSGGSSGEPEQDLASAQDLAGDSTTVPDLAADDLGESEVAAAVDVAQPPVDVATDLTQPEIVPDVPPVEEIAEPDVVDVTIPEPDVVDVTTAEAPTLTSSHPGWKEPKCWNCHDADDHNTGLDPYVCAGCHGTNGAPKGHATSGCGGCHSGKHGAGFPAPISCLVCHPK